MPSERRRSGESMTRFSGEIAAPAAQLRMDAIALAQAWAAKQADISRAEAALDACRADLTARFGFDQLGDNERAKVPGVDRYYDLDDLVDELRDEADGLVCLLADAPCQSPAAAAATLGVAVALFSEHACVEKKLLARLHGDARSWAGVAPIATG